MGTTSTGATQREAEAAIAREVALLTECDPLDKMTLIASLLHQLRHSYANNFSGIIGRSRMRFPVA